MAMDLTRVVVVDIEATCWEGKPPQGQKNEIIEFGIALLNVKTGEVEANEGILVKPITSEISPFCTSLTTITPEMVATDGLPFAEACAYLQQQYQTKNRIWASYGAYDYNQIQKQCLQQQVLFPLGVQHLNVKAFFNLKHKMSYPVGMSQALEKLGLPLTGTHHRGVDDSRNIAAILAHLLR
ncbi:MAG TPA: DNA polymerase III [Microscillaceae bacterium]|jgi:inhibitor of KinA sporulation pathway (predicted exonuclease)|nr:DNA polymerase III [Microscillaceae bacterium]